MSPTTHPHLRFYSCIVFPKCCQVADQRSCHVQGVVKDGDDLQQLDYDLSYDVAVIQWITSCNKNRMTTHVITLWQVHATSSTTSVSTMRFSLNIAYLKTMKSHFDVSYYDKQNLTLVVISYEIYETSLRPLV